jgi:hypothetical protein
MAKAKNKKQSSGKKTTARGRKSSARKKPATRPKARQSRRKTAGNPTAGKRTAPRKRPTRRGRGGAGSLVSSRSTTRGLGLEAGGQSGDTEGLASVPLADSESVEELLEEGQAFEAGIVSGVENARDADKGEVRTRQVPEDDVPQEYLDED